MCKLKGNNSIIKYLCKDIDGSCKDFKVKSGSTILVCKDMDENGECKNIINNVNRLVVDFKRVAKDLNFDVSKILKP